VDCIKRLLIHSCDNLALIGLTSSSLSIPSNVSKRN